MERYLVKPFVGSSHYWALEILKTAKPGQRVLDIGPGSGVMGQILRENGVNDTFAVEIDEAARKHVAPFYLQVEESLLPLRNHKFDWLLLLDVLEHMEDPFGFLKEVNDLLAPHARILISLPNVAHWSVRFPLLFGFFEYTSRGILDRTHLQFFNRRRFRKLIATIPDWKVIDFNASIEPLEFVLPNWLWDNSVFPHINRARWKIAQTVPGLMAYQHLACLEKRG